MAEPNPRSSHRDHPTILGGYGRGPKVFFIRFHIRFCRLFLGRLAKVFDLIQFMFLTKSRLFGGFRQFRAQIRIPREKTMPRDDLSAKMANSRPILCHFSKKHCLIWTYQNRLYPEVGLSSF